MTVLLLALNEVNFGHVRSYIDMGKLPVLGQLLARHNLIETSSEADYEELEPWIQWVTAQTGKPLAEHGVFRLGDIVQHDLPQIWEVLEAQGLTVGAISPMNANNRCRSAAFFVPDPWTPTPVTGSWLLKKFYGAVAQAVNENAQSRLSLSSAVWLLAGLAAYARPVNYGRYLSLVASALRRRSWARALILDQALADMFVRLGKRTRPDFASLFLNAGAHIQHHYMFNSSAYDGPQANPEWYVGADSDPVLEVYELYDHIIGQIAEEFPNARLMLATGLHQDPHPDTSFYWRLRDHAAFLDRIGVKYENMRPLMSRDFVIDFANVEQAAAAERHLRTVKAADGTALFDIDNRGLDLFVMLTWPHDIGPGFEYYVGDAQFFDLRREVAFVAIKNGRHNGIGYLLDTGAVSGGGERIQLSELPHRIASACGASWVVDVPPELAPTA